MGHNLNAPASVHSPGRFLSSGANDGKWATAMLVNSILAGNGINTQALRTAEILSRDEWKVFDDAILEENRIRLRGVADLIAAGLVKRIPNGLAKTVLEYQTIGDMDEAIISLDGVTRSLNDRIEFGQAGIPLPITHKDFYINLRALLASRTSGEAMDTTHIRVATRKVAEKNEDTLFNGGPTFGGLPIYGLTTHPSRMTGSFGTGGSWSQSGKTGAQIVSDVGTMLLAFESAGFSGPYGIYIGANASLKMQEDYKAEAEATIRARILQFENVQFVRVVDTLDADEVVMVQLTPDVVQIVIGEDTQTIQWDVHGGMQINYKVMNIVVPLIRAVGSQDAGIYHMS